MKAPITTGKASKSSRPVVSKHALDLRTPATPKPAVAGSSGPAGAALPNLRWPAKAHPARFSLQVAAFLAAIVGVVVAVVLGFNVDSDIGLYVVLAGIVTATIGAILAQLALLYGISRFDDGRATPRKYWWGAARDGFMDAINADMVALIILAAAVLVGAITWRLSLRASVLSGVERGVLLAIINLILAWILLGAYTTRRIAVAAVMIGGLNSGEATKIGWRLYWHGGGHLAVTAIKTLLGRLLVVVIIAAGVYGAARWLARLPFTTTPTGIVVASAALAAIAIFMVVVVLLEWETRVWLRHYRLWATTFTPSERVRLLTGRSPSTS